MSTQKSEVVSPHHEFAIICAKPEELRQVVAVLNDAKVEKVRGVHLADHVYRIPSKDGTQSFRLIVTTCNAMGHMTAAIRTAQIVLAHQPHIVMFVGTAASLRPEEIQLGDVVVPRKAVNRFYEKITESGQKDFDTRTKRPEFKELFFGKNALVADTSHEVCSEMALGAMANLDPKTLKLDGGNKGKVVVGDIEYELRDPKLIEDVDIFSCGMVVDSLSYRNFLNDIADENTRKIGVIDMESHGFFAALKALKGTGPGTVAEGLMIRGISDYAGRKQQLEGIPTDWKNLSVRNAAVVAHSLIMELV